MNHSLNVLSFISSSPFCFGLDSNLAETGYSFSVGAEVAAATCGIYSKYLIKKQICHRTTWFISHGHVHAIRPIERSVSFDWDGINLAILHDQMAFYLLKDGDVVSDI